MHDPHVATPTQTFEDAVIDADAVVIAATPRRVLAARRRSSDSLTAPDSLIVDPWDSLGAAQVFAYAAEVAALRA